MLSKMRTFMHGCIGSPLEQNQDPCPSKNSLCVSCPVGTVNLLVGLTGWLSLVTQLAARIHIAIEQSSATRPCSAIDCGCFAAWHWCIDAQEEVQQKEISIGFKAYVSLIDMPIAKWMFCAVIDSKTCHCPLSNTLIGVALYCQEPLKCCCVAVVGVELW